MSEDKAQELRKGGGAKKAWPREEKWKKIKKSKSI